MPGILFYNSFFGGRPSLDNVPPRWRSRFLFERADFLNADALVFHVPDLVWGRPSVSEILSLEKRPGQLWVAWSMECAINYPVLNDPALRAKIDLFMTYRRSSDIWTPYLPPLSEWKHVLEAPLPAKAAAAPVVMFQSASINRSRRLEFARELMEHIRVDSFGKMLRNCDLQQPDEGPSTKLAVLARYKFCLSLENAIEEDYVTEKFFDPLRAGTVPVYRGAPNIDDFAPGDDCYIDANAFSDAKELADHLKRLHQDEAAYARFHAWRRKPLRKRFRDLLDQSDCEPLVRLAQAVERRQVER